MTKLTRTKVEFNVTLEIEHPENLDLQHVRLAARSALRGALLTVDNSFDGFDQHTFAKHEDVPLSLGTVDFE